MTGAASSHRPPGDLRSTMSSDHDILTGGATAGYDPVDGTYHIHHDETVSTPLSYGVLRGVAAITGDEPHELDSLTEVVDPDALDRLFDRDHSESSASIGRVVIEFNGCHVTVYADDQIVIEPPEE